MENAYYQKHLKLDAPEKSSEKFKNNYSEYGKIIPKKHFKNEQYLDAINEWFDTSQKLHQKQSFLSKSEKRLPSSEKHLKIRMTYSEHLDKSDLNNVKLRLFESRLNNGSTAHYNHAMRYTCCEAMFQKANNKASPYSKEHVRIICETLINTGNLTRLQSFLGTLKSYMVYDQLEIVSLAKAYVAFKTLQFQKLYEILSLNTFSPKYHPQLQRLWMAARSILVATIYRKQTPVAQKHPELHNNVKKPLKNFAKIAKEGSYYFSSDIRVALNKAYEKTMYPTSKEKTDLAMQTQLTVTQVSNWFKNKRQRARATTDKSSCFASTTGNEKSTPDINYDTTKAILIGTRTHDKQLLPFLNTRETHGFMSNSSGAILPPKNYIHKKLYNSLDSKKLHNSKATFTPICILSKCNCSDC